MLPGAGAQKLDVQYGKDDTEAPIMVRLPPEDRASAERIGDIPVRLADGRAVPLSGGADVTVTDGPAQVERD